MKDIRDSLSAAVATAAIVAITAGSPTLAQDANADAVKADQGKPTTTQVIQAGDTIQQQVPETALKFRRGRISGENVEITPDVVQRYASLTPPQVKWPTVDEAKVFSIGSFFKFREARQKAGDAGIFIGVVVADERYTPFWPGYTGRDHFRDVQERVSELVHGYKHVDVGIIPGLEKIGLAEKPDEATRVPGIAQVYGAEVQGILPLKYEEGAQRTNPDGTKVDIRVNDIIIMVNDHVFPVELEAPHHFPDTVEEMEDWLKHILERDFHLYSRSEYKENQVMILANAQRKNYEEFAVFPASDKRVQQGDGTSESTGAAGEEETKPKVTSLALNND